LNNDKELKALIFIMLIPFVLFTIFGLIFLSWYSILIYIVPSILMVLGSIVIGSLLSRRRKTQLQKQITTENHISFLQSVFIKFKSLK
jgi:ABC-type bacteriocin/lantibiotic exporter with double-glycine peptidase domain